MSKMWSQPPVEIEARPSGSSVLSLRLPTTDFHALMRAVRSANETLSEYVRKAIRMRTATHADAQVACFIGYPSTWTVVAATPIPTHNTGCSVNVDWVRT